MKIKLPVKEKWYKKIKNGEKTVEYRAAKPFWKKRIWDKRNQIDTVIFSKGYTKQTIECQVTKIRKGGCPYKGWSGEYYQIHFKRVGGKNE